MALHFMPHEETGMGSLAGILGGLSGTGLGMIGGYAANQYQLPNKIKNFQNFGFSPEESQALANSPEAIQSAAIKEKMKSREREQQAALFSNLVSGGQQMPVQKPMSPQVGMQAMGALGGPEQQAQQPQQEQSPDMGQLMNGRTVDQLHQWRDKILKSGGDPQLIKDATQLLDREIDNKLKERKQSFAEQKEIDKEIKPFVQKVNSESKEAKKTNMRLDRMQELVKKGNIRHPFWNTLFETVASGVFGPHGPKFDFHFLQNPDTQEFRKLSREFIKGAKTIFGARVTEGEIKLLLETVPSLSQTDEGKMRIINNLRILNEGTLAEKKVMDQIIKQNGGKRPENLEDLVTERLDPYLDQLSERFRKGL